MRYEFLVEDFMGRNEAMPKRITGAVLLLTVVLAAGTSGAHAQACVNRAAEGTGPSREVAMRAAYENVLRAINPSVAQGWASQGLRIGEAPGHSVGK
jgi:hypothetical protein